MPLQPWKTLHSRYVIEDEWISLRADRCVTPTGATVDPYYVLHEVGNWVQVVAFDDENRVLLTRQYRHGLAEICTEIPCGGVESGESPLEAIQRELIEETGCTANSFEPMPVVSPNPARYSNLIHPYFALGTRQVRDPKPDVTEEIEFEFLSFNEVLALIDTGKILQALHVATILQVFRKRGLLSSTDAC